MLEAPYSIVEPGGYEPEKHWYPKALNATIHPMVAFFLNLSTARIVERYCHLHPTVNRADLQNILAYRPKYFRWAGADLINVTTEGGKRQMVVIENNSCPSGQKSMPLLDDHQEYGGYRQLIERTFIPTMKGKRGLPDGLTAVIYDKNPVEASGYAFTLADLLNEPVHYIYFPQEGYQSYLRWKQGILQVRDPQGHWHSIRAAFRYVTQRPWTRIPTNSKTKILNPIISCLAGGRNKMVAAKAYDFYNAELSGTGLKINTPETIWDVSKDEVPLWVKRLGGQAVIKIPYSNAGQGVFTIINDLELHNFMAQEYDYNQFIVQSLIGNYQWSSTSSRGKLYHVGMIPNHKGRTFVADIRLMVSATPDGIKPLCIYARRAKSPLLDQLSEGQNSWDMLGTNLSFRDLDGSWNSDPSRLILMDRRDFNKLGVALDDLIEAFIQTVLSMIAIDKMSGNLTGKNGRFRKKLFQSLNNDQGLLNEMMKNHG